MDREFVAAMSGENTLDAEEWQSEADGVDKYSAKLDEIQVKIEGLRVKHFKEQPVATAELDSGLASLVKQLLAKQTEQP